MSDLEIYIDFKSAAAYLAMQPTLALLEELGTTARWLPASTRVRQLPIETPDESKGETHARIREEYRRRINRHYASVQGIPLVYPAELGASDLALVAFELHPTTPLAQALFTAYWRDNKDLDDRDTVNACLAALDCAELPNEAQCAAVLERINERSAQAGAIDTPAYIVGDEIFIGREHLPWIRELLA